MPITSTWTTPSSLDRAINDILTEAIWDNLVSNELYLWDTLHNRARTANILGTAGVFTVTAVGNGLVARSGAAGSNTRLDIGRTSAEGGLAVAAGATQFLAPSVAGDVVLVADSTNNLILGTFGAQAIQLVTNNVARWVLGSTGSLIPQADNSYDIGTDSGPFRPRNVFLAGKLVAATAVDNNVPVRLAESVLGAAAASISFTSIPSNYRHLQLVVTARGTNASTTVDILARFNNDTGANYDRAFHRQNGLNTYAGDDEPGTTSLYCIVQCPAASAAASWWGQSEMVISSYKATDKFKPFSGTAAYNQGTSMSVQTVAGHWLSTAAINRVDVFASVGNLEAGTTVTLYGLP